MATRGMNKAELNRQMALALKEAVDYTVQKIWNENRAFIQDIVYNAYIPQDYERTNEFRTDAWDTEASSTIEPHGAIARGSMKYNGTNLSTSRANGFGQHIGFDDEPCRMYLAEIIYQGLVGDFTGEYTYAHENPAFNNATWTRKRDAWKALNDWLGKNNLKKIFSEGLTKAGLQYHSHSTPIKRTIT